MLSTEEYENGHRELTLDEARRLTERIRLVAHTVAENMEKLQLLVTEAKNGNVHVQLGYASWTAYLADVLGEAPMRLAREPRQEMSRMLTDEGMSTRAAAKVLGVSKSLVATDIQVSSSGQVDDEPDEVEVDPITGEVINHPEYFESAEEEAETLALADLADDEFEERLKRASDEGDVSRENVLKPEPRTVTGLDGKTYQRAEPQKPRRRPLTDQSRTAGWDLAKSLERIERILADDRFNTHKEEVATHLRSHLTNAIDSCQGFLDRINN